MPETEQAQAPVFAKKSRVPKIFKNKIFIFGLSLGLFLISLFVLLLIDEHNELGFQWAMGLRNWLSSMGITQDIHMLTWLLFFIIFGIFFACFFIFMLRKPLLEKKAKRVYRKTGREELSKKERVRFNLFFFLFVGVVVLGAAAGVVTLFIVKGNFASSLAAQFGNLGPELMSFLAALGLLLIILLIIPVSLLLVYLIFKFFVTIVALIVGSVSNTVMKSEGYQKNMAASQAAAADIERSMREARERAGEAVQAVKDAMEGKYNGGAGGSNTPQADILFPALTNIDVKWAKIEAEKKAEEERIAKEEEEKAAALAAEQANNPNPSVEAPSEEAPKEEEEKVEEVNPNTRPPLDYEQFKLLAYEFQSYLCHEKYYFKINTLRSFIAGLAAARLILLQGLSGTGKSTLPRVFLEYIGGDAYFFPVQATWRDRSDITGYYSDFTGQFKETELLKHLYEASYIPETCNLMVLDEMNISRVEYYFADFLSIFEYPSEDWVVPLLQVKPGTVLPKYIENGMVRIPVNTWFVGTVNIDDSTFTITDKVYDRAIAIDFSELNLPFESSYRFDPHPIKITELQAMFKECKEKQENNLTPAERKKFLDLTQFISDTFDIQFGNRIMNQIDNFLPVFVGLGGTKNEALDVMIARKVLRKLEGKFESYIKDGLNKLTRYINSSYGKHALPESEAVIEKYRRKLS